MRILSSDFSQGRYPAAGNAAPLPSGGVLVTQVVSGGAAAETGIRSGDMLLTYAGKDVVPADTLKEQIAAHARAKANMVTLWREKAATTISKDVPPRPTGRVDSPGPGTAGRCRSPQDRPSLDGRPPGGDWAELPGTAAEVQALRALVPDAAVLTRQDASTAKLSALRDAGGLREIRYLHFATHGEGNADVAFESVLILHRDDMTVGRLTAREVLEAWKLDADLVTLSACETANGKFGGGDSQLGSGLLSGTL